MNGIKLMAGMRVRSGRRGFTLLELLVVVAILSILISLLLPVVQSSLNKASVLRAMSNFRQLGVAINLYAADSNDQLPGPFYRGQRSGYRSGLPNGIGARLWEYMELEEPTADYRPVPLLMVPALKSWKYDTSDYKAAYATNKGIQPKSGAVIEPFGDTGVEPMKITDLDTMGDPTLIWAIWELGGAGDPEPRFRTTYPEPIHGDKRAVLFFDWHAEAVPTDWLPASFIIP